MKTIRSKMTLSLLGLGTAAMLWGGCVVTVKPTNDPTTAPPPPPASTLTCGPNQYLRGGKHVWRGGRYVWTAPSCAARTATWRAGCRWTRGGWTKSGRRYVFRSGRLVCPAAAAGPTAMPPAPPAVAVTCAPNQYLSGGKHVWRAGRWVWINPRCISRPGTWRAGCRWTRGHWRRAGRRMRFTPGRLVCPKAVAPIAPRVVYPVMPPPARPPATYKRPRCRRGFVHYPGRYKWSSPARRYLWNAGRCIRRVAKYRRCKWIPGRWRVHSGRAYYIRPAWKCGRRTTYIGKAGAVWTPPATYKPFIRQKRCRRGWVHNAAGRCIKMIKRCPAGSVLRYGRCYKRRVFKRCGRGFALRAGRCVRTAAVRPNCRPGFALRGNRCVKVARPLKPCRAGFARRGNRCVKVARPLKPCRAGFARRGNRCVKVARPLKRCRAGFARRGNRCVKVAKPMKRCRPGFKLRGNRCVKVAKPMKRCRPGFKLRGNRCVKVARPVKRCRKGFVKRGNRCVKVKRRRR